MTNRWVAERYDERVQRAALAVEPLDYGRRRRIALPLAVSLEGAAAPRLDRHASALRVLVSGSAVGTELDVRIDDPFRRYVPRRLRVTIPEAATLEAADDGDPVLAPALRLLRPTLFPGAAYDVPDVATGIRGRAVRDGAPLAWARVEATLVPGGEPVGRAQGDDRGEFLLLLGTNPANPATLTPTLTVHVTVRGPEPAPVAPAPRHDPLWALPIEEIADPAAAQEILGGEQLPPEYDPGVVDARDIEVTLGRLASEPTPFEPV